MQWKQTVNKFMRRGLLLFGILAFVLFASASQGGSASAHGNGKWGNAYVRVIHASPAAGTVDVFVDGGKLLSDFTFGTVTPYVPVPAGPHRIQVAPAGSGAGASVIDETVRVWAGKSYTVAALGTASSGFSLKVFTDYQGPSATLAKIRVYHLSPDAGPVDIATGGTTVVSGLTYPHSTPYLKVPAGTYTFAVTAVNAGATVPLTATVEAGKVYSVFAIGLLSGSPSFTFVVAVA